MWSHATEVTKSCYNNSSLFAVLLGPPNLKHVFTPLHFNRIYIYIMEGIHLSSVTAWNLLCDCMEPPV